MGQVPLDTLIPIRLASKPTGIPRRTLYWWASTGVVPTRIIDGVKCATIRDILEADATRRERAAKKTAAL